MSVWQLQTAKAKLSELLRTVRDEGPQTISVRGKEEYVVSLSQKPGTDKSAQRTSPKTLWELLEPVRGLGDDLEESLREVREERAAYEPDE